MEYQNIMKKTRKTKKTKRTKKTKIAAKVSYQSDIRPLFRVRDINAMRFKFDLSKYGDVYNNADLILDRLDAGDMPCDGAWPKARLDSFRKWIADGKLP